MKHTPGFDAYREYCTGKCAINEKPISYTEWSSIELQAINEELEQENADLLEALKEIAKLCDGHIGQPFIFSIDRISQAAIAKAKP